MLGDQLSVVLFNLLDTVRGVVLFDNGEHAVLAKSGGRHTEV